jgi:anti-sigma regulatory factor (Ser/Thr protein kinase)
MPQTAEKPTLAIRIPPDGRHARTVRDALVAFASLHGVTTADQEAMLFAVGEALANAIEHGAPTGDIKVTIEIGKQLISACVVDDGRGFRNPPLGYQPLPEAYAIRGRGIPIMQRIVDMCEVRSAPGSGTVVTLGRYRSGPPSANQEQPVRS